MTTPDPVRADRLTAADARAVVARFQADLDERLEAFRTGLRARGGPHDAVDGSFDGLERLWGWFLGLRPVPVSEEAARDRGPWWTLDHPPWVVAMGPELAHDLTGVADAYHHAASTQHAAAWRICRRRSSPEYNRPVLDLGERGEMPYTVPIVLGVRAADGEPAARQPGALRQLLERWLGLDPAHEALLARAARPLGDLHVAVEAGEAGAYRIDIDEGIARFAERRVERLAAALAADPRIESAHREDREVILVRGPVLTPDELRLLVDRLWDGGRR